MLINEKDLIFNSKTETTETTTCTSETSETTDTTDTCTTEKTYHSPATKINCALSVELDPTNIAIYVCKSSTQCFNFKALKCCGSADIKIEPVKGEGWYYNHHSKEWKKHVPCFGTFIFGNGGLCFTPDDDLKAGDFKTLTFKAKSCTAEIHFDATFVFDPCKCCCAGSACKSCCH